MKNLKTISLISTLFFSYLLAMEEIQEREKAEEHLIAAVEQGDIELVALLLNAGVSASAQNKYGDPALFFAVSKEHKEILRLLLNRGADINAKDKRGDTALHLAVILHETERVVLLLSNGANTEVQANHGWTALHLAASYGRTELLELLLNYGANINARDDKGMTALANAVLHGDKHMVDVLIAYGADMEVQDDHGFTALHVAAYYGRTEVAALLLNKGAVIDAGYHTETTPLILAAAKGEEQIVALLLNAGADSNAKNRHSCWTALICATEAGHKKIVALLIKNGASITAQEYSGKSALTLAKERETCQLLELCNLPEVQAYLSNPLEYVKKDTNRFATTNTGQTWLMIACIFGHIEVISFYKSYSLEFINAKDYYGRTAFDYADTYSFDSVIRLVNTFGEKINQLNPQKVSLFTTLISYIPYIGISKKDALLKCAVERGMLPFVNALLSIGAQPTLELAKEAGERGHLKIMHRILFIALTSIPEYKRQPYLALSGLFK